MERHVRIQVVTSLLLGAAILLAGAAPAGAQGTSSSQGDKLFSRVSFIDTTAPPAKLVLRSKLMAETAFGLQAAAAKATPAKASMSWAPIVLVGFNTGGGAGVAVGGG